MTETIPPAKVKPGEMHGTASHLRVLCRCLSKITKGWVIECGAGYYSTPVIDAVCDGGQIPRVLIERDGSWRLWVINTLWCGEVESRRRFVRESIDELPSRINVDSGGDEPIRFSLAFIDSYPRSQRREDWNIVAPRSDIIILHDAQYDLSMHNPQPDTFRYRYLDDSHENYTLVVSNVVNVAEWFK